MAMSGQLMCGLTWSSLHNRDLMPDPARMVRNQIQLKKNIIKMIPNDIPPYWKSDALSSLLQRGFFQQKTGAGTETCNHTFAEKDSKLEVSIGSLLSELKNPHGQEGGKIIGIKADEGQLGNVAK